jgi:hypothetical protein
MCGTAAALRRGGAGPQGICLAGRPLLVALLQLPLLLQDQQLLLQLWREFQGSDLGSGAAWCVFQLLPWLLLLPLLLLLYLLRCWVLPLHTLCLLPRLLELRGSAVLQVPVELQLLIRCNSSLQGR